MNFTYAGKVLTHYTLEGPPDAPAVVFINSLGTDLRLWDAVALDLRDEYRLIRYDKRGHGLSDQPTGPYNLHDFVDDLRALLEQLQIEPIALVGISIGGLIALGYALEHAEEVSHLVLADTAGRLGSEEGWQARIRMINELGMERAAPEIIAVWFARSYASAEPAIYRGYMNMLASMPAGGYVATCTALRDADLTPRLSEVRAKTLVLFGDKDAAVSPQHGRALAEAIPGAQFGLIGGAGHLPCVERPQAMANSIREFLQEQRHA